MYDVTFVPDVIANYYGRAPYFLTITIMNAATANEGAKMSEKPTELEQVISRLEKVLWRAHSIDQRLLSTFEKLAGGISVERVDNWKPSRSGIIWTILDLIECIETVQGSQEDQIGMIRNII